MAFVHIVHSGPFVFFQYNQHSDGAEVLVTTTTELWAFACVVFDMWSEGLSRLAGDICIFHCEATASFASRSQEMFDRVFRRITKRVSAGDARDLCLRCFVGPSKRPSFPEVAALIVSALNKIIV